MKMGKKKEKGYKECLFVAQLRNTNVNNNCLPKIYN